MGIYDTTGRVGTAKAHRQYFLDMKKVEAEKESKAAGRKLGMAGTKGMKELQDFFNPSKLTVDSQSIFQFKTPENLFDKIGHKLTGPDLSKTILTEEAMTKGYDITQGTFKPKLGKPVGTSTLTKGGETVSTQYGGAGTKLGGLFGAYQAGTGLATVFDPNASVERKIAGGANIALGANALLALGGQNLWNPVGWGSLLAGGVASLADIFG